MKVTVCDFPDEEIRQASAWDALVEFIAQGGSDLLVLPEMPFTGWCFGADTFDAAVWDKAVRRHNDMMPRLGELGAGAVITSRPVSHGGQRLNRAFVWDGDAGERPWRSKYFLPDIETARETTWFDRGDGEFPLLQVGDVKAGVQMCSELMFPEKSRAIGAAGAQLIAAPRATGGHDRWSVAIRMTAVLSGCFVVSANRRSHDGNAFAGCGWIVSPEGDILGQTSEGTPFVTVEIDPAQADLAKTTYPRNVEL